MHKVLTARIPADQVAELRRIAMFDGVALADEVREAIRLLLESKRGDANFHKRVREAMESGQKLLEQLGETDVAARLDPSLIENRAPAGI